VLICDWGVMFVVWSTSFLVVCVVPSICLGWYYVVCMGCLLYWCWCIAGVCVILLCKRGCCVCYTDAVIHICERFVSVFVMYVYV